MGVRVLAVMLAGVLAVQFANFTLLQFVPLPQPPMFSVDRVAQVLREGRDASGELRFLRNVTPDPNRGGRATALAGRLAAQLRVAVDGVRVSFVNPPSFFPWGPRGGARGRRPHAFGPADTLFGDFTASLRQPDGHWLAVQPIRSGMNAWRVRLLFWLLVAVVTVSPFAWWLARWVARPVAMFADAADRIGRNPRTPPLPTEGPAEIAHAANSFNEMQRRLNRWVDDRTIMIGAIAHDLRTPLMRMSLRLDHVPEDIGQALRADVADMEALVAAAAAYVREATDCRPRHRLDLRSLVESVVDQYADRGEAVVVVPGEHVTVSGDAVALKALVDNLVSNALRYAGDAELTIGCSKGSAILEIRDHGPGVPVEDLDRLFEPFFRGDPSRNRETGGVGLGLASVRGVARAHGGDVTAESSPGSGLLVRVMLPVG